MIGNWVHVLVQTSLEQSAGIWMFLGLFEEVREGVEEALDHHNGSVIKSVTHSWSERFEVRNLREMGRSEDDEFNIYSLGLKEWDKLSSPLHKFY